MSIQLLIVICLMGAFILTALGLVVYSAIQDRMRRRPAHPWYRVMSRERAGLIYRAMNGDEEAQRVVTLDEVAELENASSFEHFLQYNRHRFEVYDGPGDGVQQESASCVANR